MLSPANDLRYVNKTKVRIRKPMMIKEAKNSFLLMVLGVVCRFSQMTSEGSGAYSAVRSWPRKFIFVKFQIASMKPRELALLKFIIIQILMLGKKYF